MRGNSATWPASLAHVTRSLTQTHSPRSTLTHSLCVRVLVSAPAIRPSRPVPRPVHPSQPHDVALGLRRSNILASMFIQGFSTSRNAPAERPKAKHELTIQRQMRS